MSRRKKAVIVGCNGQDGRLLYALLEGKGYALVGLARGGIRSNLPRWKRPIDIASPRAVLELIRRFKPDEIYYLAAFHHSSEDRPLEPYGLFQKSYEIHVLALLNFLEAMRKCSRSTRLFYAASSQVFGAPARPLQDEKTPIAPNNIYGITKVAGLMACRFYREREALFVSVGYLYNHESPLREPRFVSQKIVRGALAIKQGRLDRLILGDLTAQADWGYAPDYVEAMHRILTHSTAEDFVVATGRKHSVLDMVKAIFKRLGLDWRAYVREDRGIVAKQGSVLIGNPRKLKRLTGWKPSVSFEGMIEALLKA